MRNTDWLKDSDLNIIEYQIDQQLPQKLPNIFLENYAQIDGQMWAFWNIYRLFWYLGKSWIFLLLQLPAHFRSLFVSKNIGPDNLTVQTELQFLCFCCRIQLIMLYKNMYIRKIPSKEDSIINKNIQDQLDVVGLNCPRYKLPGNRTFLSLS